MHVASTSAKERLKEVRAEPMEQSEQRRLAVLSSYHEPRSRLMLTLITEVG
jgi:hypothetical protein